MTDAIASGARPRKVGQQSTEAKRSHG